MGKLRGHTATRLHRNIGSLFVDEIKERTGQSIHPYWFHYAVFHLLQAEELDMCTSMLVSEDYIWTRLKEAPETNGYMLQLDYKGAYKRAPNPILQQWLAFVKESLTLLSRGDAYWSRANIWHQLCEEVSVQNPFFPHRPKTDTWSPGRSKLRRSHSANEPWRKAVQGMVELLPDGIRGGHKKGEYVVAWGYNGVILVHAKLEQEPLVIDAQHGMTRGATVWRGDVLSWGEDGRICRWSSDGELLEEHAIGIPISVLHWVDEHSFLAYPCSPWYDPEEDPEDGTIVHWDLQEACKIREFEAHEGDSVQNLLIEGERIISWDRNGFIIEWVLQTGEVLRNIEAHKEGVVALSRIDTERFISTGAEGVHRVWRQGKKKGKKLSGLSAYAGHICVGEYIAAWDDAGGLSFHHIDGKKPIAIQNEHGSWIEGAMHWKDSIIVTWTNNLTAVMQEPPDPILRLWNVETGEKIGELYGHQEGVCRVFKHEGMLISSSLSAEIICWGDPLKPTPKAWNGHSAEPNCILSASKDEILSTGIDGILFRTRVRDFLPLDRLPRLLRRMATFACGHHIVSVAYEGQIDIFDRNGSSQGQFDVFAEQDAQGNPIPWYRRSFGKYVIGGLPRDEQSFWVHTRNGELTLWNLKGERLCSYQGHTECVDRIARLQTGHLLSLSWDNSAILWEEDGTIRYHWDQFSGWTWAYLEQQDRIFIGDLDGVIQCYDLHAGTKVARLKGMKAWVLGMVVLRDGRILAHGHDAPSIPIWNPSSKKKWKPALKYTGHGTTTVFGVFQRANGHCVSWDQDGYIHVWDPKTGAEIWQYCTAEAVSESESFSAKSSILGALEIGSDIVLWTAKLEWFCLREGELIERISEEEAAWYRPDWIAQRQSATNLRSSGAKSVAWPDGEGRRRCGQEDRFARNLIFHSGGEGVQWHYHDNVKIEQYDERGVWLSDARGDTFRVEFST